MRNWEVGFVVELKYLDLVGESWNWVCVFSWKEGKMGFFVLNGGNGFGFFFSFKADLLECSAMSDREYSILEGWICFIVMV